MAIHISGWTICLSDELIARQYDNLRRIEVAGDIPEGYSWDLLLCYGNLYDAIPLQADSDGLSATLTAAQCSESGPYYIQLRGASADGAVRHTNVVSAIVPPSLSGTASWPTIPSEFEALEARMRDIAAHPPIPGEDGKWQIWDVDAGKYVQSNFVTPAGPSGSPGIVISSTQPTDPNHPVWLDPDGDASAIPWVPQPATAAVGQTVKVSAVDSSGRPTAWVAADFPSGGESGSSFPKYELLVDHTVQDSEVDAARLVWVGGTDGIPDFAPYNAFYISIFADEKFGFGKWTAVCITTSVGRARVASVSGSNAQQKSMAASWHRLIGKWAGSYVYNPSGVGEIPLLVSPEVGSSEYLSHGNDIQKIDFGSYGASFGLVSGMHIQIYGAK